MEKREEGCRDLFFSSILVLNYSTKYKKVHKMFQIVINKDFCKGNLPLHYDNLSKMKYRDLRLPVFPIH